MKTIDEEKRKEIFSLIEGYLKEDLVLLEPLQFKLTESLATESCKVTIQLMDGEIKKTLTSSGSGIVEGIFNALKKHYSKTYKSLETVRFTDFGVKTKLKTSSLLGTNADAKCVVRLSLINGTENSTIFVGRSRSLSGASVKAVVDAYQYYINAEKCFFRLKELIGDARNRNRGDLLSTLVYDISRIVSVTKYDDLCDKK
jgi:hypothetical protein